VRLIRQLLDNLHSFLEESEASLPHPSTNHGTGTDGAVSIQVAERVQQEVLNCDMKLLSVACQWFHCQTCATMASTLMTVHVSHPQCCWEPMLSYFKEYEEDSY